MGQRAMVSVFVSTSSTNFMGAFVSVFSFVFITLFQYKKLNETRDFIFISSQTLIVCTYFV